MTAGLFLVAPVDLGLPADRLAVRDPRRARHDRGPELALEALADDRHVGLTHRYEDLLASRASLDASGRLLVRHSLEGRAHLVQVCLRLGLDRHLQGRRRELDRIEDERLVLAGQRVARLGDGQLGDRTDLAGLQLADRLLLLAVQEQQLADALLLAAGRVEDGRLAVERAGYDAQVRESADERIRRGLEDPNDERAGRIGRHLHVAFRLRVPCLDGRLVRGRGEIPDEGVQERPQPDALGRAAHEHRRKDRLLDAFPKARLQLRVADVLAFQVLRQDVVVGFCGGLQQLVPSPVDLPSELVGDRNLGLLLAVPAECLAVDEIDVAGERLRDPDRQVEWGNLRPE